MTKGSLNRAATSVHLLGGAVGLLGLTAVMATIAQAVSRVDLHAPDPAAFRLLGLRLTAPSANVSGLVLLVLAAAGTGILLAGLRSAWRLEHARRRLLRSLRTTRSRLGDAGAIVFEDPRPRAFCMGYVRPRIYISDGALRRSTADEMSAVLAHEDEHRRRRDPLRLACARVLCDALFFLPVVRALRDRDAALAELAALDPARRRSLQRIAQRG